MFIISMPAASLIYGFDAFLKVMYCNGFECSGDAVTDARI